MTKDELIEMLEPYEGDTEIRYMEQPHYPFEYTLESRVFDVSPAPDACGECGLTERAHEPTNTGSPPRADHEFEPYESFAPAEPHGETVVYLLEGAQLGYGTRRAWDA